MRRSIRHWGLLVGILMIAPVMAADKEHRYGDWALRCPDKKSCGLEQRVFVEGAENTPLVHMVFQTTSQAQDLAVLLRVPLGILLNPGLQLQIDQGIPQTFPLHHCRLEGCLAVFPLTTGLRQILESGREAQVSFHMLDGRRIGVPVSLLGVTAGLKALNEKTVHVRQHDDQ
jgi:invasion protein IalB